MSALAFWDGRSRALLRVGVAVIAASDLISLTVDLFRVQPVAIALSAIVGVAGLVQFGRGRAPIVSAIVALVVMASFAEVQAAMLGGPRRNVFASGAVLLGWLIGLAWGRALGDARREDLAEHGAMGTLAATYVGAASSKLLAHGFDWADRTTLRTVLLTQHRVSEHGVLASATEYLVTHPAASQLFAVATLVIQFGAVLFLIRPWLRVAWGTLLLSFHLGVLALTGIYYGGNVKLLLLFAYPWPALFRLREEHDTPRARDAESERRVLIAAIAIAVVLIALAWLLPLRAFTRRYPT